VEVDSVRQLKRPRDPKRLHGDPFAPLIGTRPAPVRREAETVGDLAEMAQRLEAALRRPIKPVEEAKRKEAEDQRQREAEAKRREEEDQRQREREAEEAEAKRREEEDQRQREAEARRREEEDQRQRKSVRSAPRALDNVLPVIRFEWTPGQNIKIKPGTAFPLQLPLPSSKKDHADRLTACRSLAEELKEELSQRQFDLLSEYRNCIVRYLTELPVDSGPERNFLPADNQARILRALFASQATTLGTSIRAKLIIFLQSHQGVRVFYPSLRRYYEDVRNGYIEDPLPLEAMMQFVAGINEHTPTVFDPEVKATFAGSSTPIPNIPTPPTDNLRTNDPTQLRLMPDPLVDDVDPQKSHDFMFANMANSLWRVLSSFGKKIGDTMQGWEKAYDVLRGPFEIIVDWLARFTAGGGPPPPLG
jgi:hypothetical protein